MGARTQQSGGIREHRDHGRPMASGPWSGLPKFGIGPRDIRIRADYFDKSPGNDTGYKKLTDVELTALFAGKTVKLSYTSSSGVEHTDEPYVISPRESTKRPGLVYYGLVPERRLEAEVKKALPLMPDVHVSVTQYGQATPPQAERAQGQDAALAQRDSARKEIESAMSKFGNITGADGTQYGGPAGPGGNG